MLSRNRHPRLGHESKAAKPSWLFRGCQGVKPEAYLILLGQGTDVVLEGIGHPSPLHPHIRHPLQHIPSLVALACRHRQWTASASGPRQQHELLRPYRGVLQARASRNKSGVWREASALSSELIPACSRSAGAQPAQSSLTNGSINELIKVHIVGEDDMAAHVEQKALGGHVRAGQAASLLSLQEGQVSFSIICVSNYTGQALTSAVQGTGLR